MTDFTPGTTGAPAQATSPQNASSTDPTGEHPLAVVTGASSGIGLEIARELADEGFDLVVAAEDAGIVAAAADLRGHGVMVHAVQADLSTAEGVERLTTSIAAAGRPLDAVAINAGIGVGGPFVDTPLDDEITLVDLNVTSALRLTKAVLPSMVERGEGHLLFTSSIASTQPGPFEAVYSASKSFVQSFAESIREEVRDSGVTVTALMPGPTATNFFHRAGMDDTRAGSGHQDDAAQVAAQGVRGMLDGDDKVVAGTTANKVISALGRITPDRLKARSHRVLSEPGTGSDG